MKKLMILAAALCAAVNLNAQTTNNNISCDTVRARVEMKRNRALLEEDFSLSEPGFWTSNWFIGAQAGASVYVGKPLGCADAFDRVSPNIHIYGGKWFTPAVGGRITYQGFEIKDCSLNDMTIHSVHADLMYNVMSFRYSQSDNPRFDLIPYAGCGLIHNSDLHRSDFSLNYGVQAKYHLTNRLHLTAEASGLTTFQQFDGIGASDRFGDHKFDLSLGLSVNIGKVGFHKAKAQPIAYRVIESAHAYRTYANDNDNSDSLEEEPLQTVSWSITTSSRKYPVNDYSGLNSLRARLAEAGKSTDNNNANAQTDLSLSALCHCNDSTACMCSDCHGECSGNGHCGKPNTKNESAKATLVNGADTLGLTVPYICYFKINTHNLTDNSQLDYLSEIVKLAKERNMAIRVIGAADSATGTADLNQRLSEDRADYISDQLMALGMGSEHIEVQALGGIEEFTPIANNRYCKILLIPFNTSE